jgi:hypothetical protein
MEPVGVEIDELSTCNVWYRYGYGWRLMSSQPAMSGVDMEGVATDGD